MWKVCLLARRQAIVDVVCAKHISCGSFSSQLTFAPVEHPTRTSKMNAANSFGLFANMFQQVVSKGDEYQADSYAFAAEASALFASSGCMTCLLFYTLTFSRPI